MTLERTRRRLLLRADAIWTEVSSLLGRAVDPDENVHTTVTFRAVVDAVLPATPRLAEELGPEHEPGGLAVDLDDFVVTYVNDLFQFGLPHFGPRGNLPLANPVAHVLDAAAAVLLARGDNESTPRGRRVTALLGPGDPSPWAARVAAGPFAKLSRTDRLRAVSILDEFELEVSPFDDSLFELDAGVVGQLVVGFTELIYYSEWDGYEEFTRPPSRRTHPNVPAAVQSWRQTGYPGVANGYAALRGYLGVDGGSLGEGEPWTTVDPDATAPVRVFGEAGSFRENDYDTSDYEEPYPEAD